MEILTKNTGAEWTLSFTCVKCQTESRASRYDLEADEFKVSGYFFDGTDVCERKLYVTCPACSQPYMLNSDEVALVPYLLNQEASQHADGNELAFHVLCDLAAVQYAGVGA
jgi:hypothetical protein